MKTIYLFTLCLGLAAQNTASVSGKAVIDSSSIAKKLYGGRLPVLHATANLKNAGPATVNIGGADINLALSTLPTIPSSEGSALVNQAYQRQPVERASGIITMLAAGAGLAAAVGSPITIPARILAYILFGVGFGNQALLPFLGAGQPALPTFNPCDQLAVSLAAGQSLSCDLWVEKPGKRGTLPSSITFELEAVPPVAPLPPVPPPVMLRRKAAIDPPPVILEEAPAVKVVVNEPVAIPAVNIAHQAVVTGSAKDLLDQGRVLMSVGWYRAAVGVLTDAVQTDPNCGACKRLLSTAQSKEF